MILIKVPGGDKWLEHYPKGIFSGTLPSGVSVVLEPIEDGFTCYRDGKANIPLTYVHGRSLQLADGVIAEAVAASGK
jgi:hypothetical protein